MQSQSPLVGASGPAYMCEYVETVYPTSQSPLVGASGPANMLDNQFYPTPRVSIPSGRGFWAGRHGHQRSRLSPRVSIPSGRGFWAGELLERFGEVEDVASHIKWFCFI